MLSFMGLRGRVLHAQTDGEDLIVRRTQLFSSEKEDVAPLDLFFRFLVSAPVGITTLRTFTLPARFNRMDEITVHTLSRYVHTFGT